MISQTSLKLYYDTLTGLQSANMVAMQLAILNQKLISFTIRQMLSTTSILWSLAGNKAVTAMTRPVVKSVRDSMIIPIVASSGLSRSAVKPVKKQAAKRSKKGSKR